MAGVNKVIIVGNLGADPEVKSFANGGRICNLRIATSEAWTDKMTNERKERTEWHSIVLDNDNLVKIAEQYLRKGSKVYVEGQLRTRKWQDRDGNDRYTTEIHVGRFKGELALLDRREGSGGGYGGGDDHGAPAPRSPAGTPVSGGFANKPSSGFDDDMDDDVPF
ncbi:MAG: single-stranded DNA-binding protein [Sandarakinorhabdus sp.]|nr:single-stranded DNA-binding protein [Sandarakinorhabdus sp.]